MHPAKFKASKRSKQPCDPIPLQLRQIPHKLTASCCPAGAAHPACRSNRSRSAALRTARSSEEMVSGMCPTVVHEGQEARDGLAGRAVLALRCWGGSPARVTR